MGAEKQNNELGGLTLFTFYDENNSSSNVILHVGKSKHIGNDGM